MRERERIYFSVSYPPEVDVNQELIEPIVIFGYSVKLHRNPETDRIEGTVVFHNSAQAQVFRKKMPDFEAAGVRVKEIE